MRRFTNITAFLLRLYRYKNKKDPFKIFKSLRKEEHIPKATKGNVIILPIRVAPISNLFEGIYGYALKLRGYNVHALFCGQAVKKCDNLDHSSSCLNCSLCLYEQKYFANAFNIKAHYSSHLLSKNESNELKNIVYTTQIDDLLNLSYDDCMLGIHIKSAVMRYLLESNINLAEHEKLIREFAYTTLVFYITTKKMILELKPKFAISSHGVYSLWGGAVEACNKYGVDIVVWGRGYIGGNILMSWNKSYLYEIINEPISHWKDINLTDNMIRQMDNYFLEKKKPSSTVDMINYYSKIKKANVNIYDLLNINKKKVVFGLFPNIPWDGTAFASTKAFPTLQVFLKETIDWFKKHSEYYLIIRAHPAELRTNAKEKVKDLINNITTHLPKNIYYLSPDHPISSYEVEEISICSLFYAGTMALEFAYWGKNVIQVGKTNSSNKNIVFEANSLEEYKELLSKIAIGSLTISEQMKTNARKYAYHWIFRRHIPDNTYSRNYLEFKNYNFISSMDLSEGKNKVIDWFVNCCENKKPFYWE